MTARTIRYSILFVASAFAQNIDPIDVVDVRPTSTVELINDGFQISLDVHLAIKEQWHINANEPNDKFLIPTVLSIDSSDEYYQKDVAYPSPKITKLQFSTNELKLYDGRTVITSKIVVSKNYRKKSIMISGTLQYQPCNDETCLYPVKKPFSVTVQLK